MLLFVVSFADDPFAGGTFEADGEPIRLHSSLNEAEAAAIAPSESQPAGRIFVIDGDEIDIEEGDGPTTHAIPETAVLNRNPYRAPISVEAGGGYVIRMHDAGLELLLIFRRGSWDLPKGKQDDEDIEACAVREVAEEVGIERGALQVISDLGTTVHGYTWPKTDAYAVKTTRWYAMTTTATSFVPQTAEDIEAVTWVPWKDAGSRLGFSNLRDHHAGIEMKRLVNLLTGGQD